MCKDDNRVNLAIKIIFDATWSLLIVGQSNSLYETYFCSISSFPAWQPALLQAEHDPRLRSLGSWSRLRRLRMCLRWRRHDDGRWSRGDIYDVNVHRLSLNDQKLHFYRIHIYTISMSCTSWDLAVGPCALVPQCREAHQTLHTDCPHNSLERGCQSSQVQVLTP